MAKTLTFWMAIDSQAGEGTQPESWAVTPEISLELPVMASAKPLAGWGPKGRVMVGRPHLGYG